MVEGPGATRNGRKLIRALQRKVIDAEFPLRTSTTPLQIVGLFLLDAFTVGKELFLIFSKERDVNNETSTNDNEIALRLHFGMTGCLYNGGSSGKVNLPKWRKDEVPSLRICFGQGITKKRKRSTTITSGNNNGINEDKITETISMVFEARRTTVTGPISANTARLKLQRLSARDVCSNNFDANSVYEHLIEKGRSNTNLIISDAILDQDYFPGVGNIIKIEALHRACVDPRRTLNSLSVVELRRTVAFCRRYSLGWLNTGHAPEKFVYNKTVCGTCHESSVSMQKIGGDNGKNSSNSNNGDNNVNSSSTSSSTTNRTTINERSFSSTTANFMSRTTFWCTKCQPPESVSSNIQRISSNDNRNLALTPRVTGMDGSDNRRLQQQKQQQHFSQCPQHGTYKVKLCRVRKIESINFSRLFRICQHRNCEFFSWADTKFPYCSCDGGGRKKVSLKVSKTARSGGRWFFGCARRLDGQGQKNCGFFEWAQKEHLDSLGSSLNPLL